MSRAPVPDQEVPALRALIVGLCVLLVMTPAVAAANGQQNGAHGKARKAKSAKASSLTLEQKLAVKIKAARKYRGAIRFLHTHRSLAQASGKHATALQRAERRLATATREASYYRKLIRARDARSAGATSRARHAPHCDLRGVRAVLPPGPRRRVVRVRSPDDRAERPVPRPVPDGRVGPCVRGSRRHGVRAGRRRVQALREDGTRLEPVELSLGCLLTEAIFVAKSGAGGRARVPFHLSFW